jgi:signal transduction histidine kinase
MTLHTPGEEEARMTEVLSAAQREISSLRQAINDLTKKVNAGEDITQTEAKSAMSALSVMMRNCISVEVQLGKLKASRSDIAQGGYAIDHDAARAEIRCALARIRPCCGAGAVSG